MKVNIGKYKKNRKVKIRIDTWDTWSLDATLALIIVPLLKQLKETKHGTPHTYEEDAPEHLRNLSEEEDKETVHPSGYCEPRWNYILDEMIWAFKQDICEFSEEDMFYHNGDQLELIPVQVDGSDLSKVTFNYQKDPNKPPYTYDKEGHKRWEDRKQNGYRLFGKYYSNLWD